jgi:tRNA-2-methylthio-N6-dimethylallyladenosine synthase
MQLSLFRQTSMAKKLFIKTNGCQMNDYDSSKMADVLNESHQLNKTDDVEQADVILLNTCSIREKAQEKVFSQLGQWREYKKSHPNVVIGVGGCVASQEGHDIIKRAPFVDMVFGPQTIHRLPQMLDEVLEKKKAVVDISFPEIEKFDYLPQPQAKGPIAFVSIMEGCSKYCSYCVVPYTRGEEISRPFDDVLAECYQLAEQGVREINLLGQNVNDYRGQMNDGQIADLALLIHFVAALDGIERIRFTTSHPLAFSDNLIQAYAAVPELANHLHLPVQSGSDRILAMMKRGYTSLEFKSKIRKLKKVRPDIHLSTDIIVGFPGETDDDFQKTMDLVHEMNFDVSFSFIYSPRPGTPAANFADKTPMEIKKQRLQILQNRLNIQASRIAKTKIGTKQRVLVTGPSKKNPQQIAGRTGCNRVVNFIGDATLIGQFVTVEIHEALPNSLRGELVENSLSQAS